MPATIVGARSGCRPTTSRRARFVHVGETREQQFDGGELEPVAVHAGWVVGVELLLDRGGGGRGAGDGDSAPDGRALVGGQPVEEDRAHVAREVLQLVWRGRV